MQAEVRKSIYISKAFANVNSLISAFSLLEMQALKQARIRLISLLLTMPNLLPLYTNGDLLVEVMTRKGAQELGGMTRTVLPSAVEKV